MIVFEPPPSPQAYVLTVNQAGSDTVFSFVTHSPKPGLVQDIVNSIARTCGVGSSEIVSIDASPWLTRFSRELERISRLSLNWNANHGSAPTPQAVSDTRQFLESLPSGNPFLRPTRIAPTAEGAIAVSFLRGHVRASIEFHGGETVGVIAQKGKPTWVGEVTDKDALRTCLDAIAAALAGRSA